jgi:hypothetical protein
MTAAAMHVVAAGVVWVGLEAYDQSGESGDDAKATPVSAIPAGTTIDADTVVVIGGDVNAPVTVRPDYSATTEE